MIFGHDMNQRSSCIIGCMLTCRAVNVNRPRCINFIYEVAYGRCRRILLCGSIFTKSVFHCKRFQALKAASMKMSSGILRRVVWVP